LTHLLDDFEVAAIKIGLVPTGETVEAVARLIRTRSLRNVVVDPVMKSTSGFRLIEDDALLALRQKLFPLASIVTPNVVEAEQLSGVAIATEDSTLEAAANILLMGPEAVLVTGGDAGHDEATDLLVDRAGHAFFRSKRIQSMDTHGTGCTMSSAIASLLAVGYSLREAVPLAKDYVATAIEGAPGLGSGHGPLNHAPRAR
jgi:hydroxymethylpyrimidine/phosphomethylpyrimidine kinase